MKYKIFTSFTAPETQVIIDTAKVMGISVEEDVFGFTTEDYKAVIDKWIQEGNTAICINIADDNNIYGLNENVIFLDDNVLERFCNIVGIEYTDEYKHISICTNEGVLGMLDIPTSNKTYATLTKFYHYLNINQEDRDTIHIAWKKYLNTLPTDLYVMTFYRNIDCIRPLVDYFCAYHTKNKTKNVIPILTTTPNNTYTYMTTNMNDVEHLEKYIRERKVSYVILYNHRNYYFCTFKSEDISKDEIFLCMARQHTKIKTEYECNATLTTIDMYKSLGYLLYSFLMHGLLSKKGVDIVNNIQNLSFKEIEDIFDTMHLPFEDIKEFGEVL